MTQKDKELPIQHENDDNNDIDDDFNGCNIHLQLH